MKTHSAKAKGRRAVAELKESLMKRFPILKSDDLIITCSGETGEDLKMSPVARCLLPFNFEVKNTEKLNIWSAIKQSRTHGEHIPAVVFKRNRSELFICMSVEDFLKTYRVPE